MDVYKNRIDRAVVLHHKDVRVDGDIIYLSIYMASLL